MKKEKTGIYFEVAYYVGETQEIATKGDVYFSTFDTEKEALNFYNLKKNDSDKHMFWITVRDSNDDLIDDVLID